MMIRKSQSTESEKCARCNATTNQFKVYEKNGIKISIPACENHYESIEVFYEAKGAIKLIEVMIKETATEGQGHTA